MLDQHRGLKIQPQMSDDEKKSILDEIDRRNAELAAARANIEAHYPKSKTRRSNNTRI